MLFQKKEKRNKTRFERFDELKANGVAVDAINLSIKKEGDGARLEVMTPDVTEALHYDHVDFELRTSVKLLKVGGSFREAVDEKRFKVYIFEIDSFEQFFI